MPRTHNRRGDSGASGLQYAGVIVIAAAIMAALVLAIPGSLVQDRVYQAICEILQLDNCKEHKEDPGLANDPRCTNQLTVRDKSLNGAFRGIRAEQRGLDYVTKQTDPATGEKNARYTLHGTTSAGVDGSNQQKLSEDLNAKNKPQWEGFVEAGYGDQMHFDYSGDDAWSQAENAKETYKGNWFKEWGSTALGSAGPAVETGISKVSEGAERGWNWLTGGDREEEIDKKYKPLTPDAVTMELNGRAGGSFSYKGQSVDADVTARNMLTVDKKFNRTHEAWLDGDANVNLSKALPLPKGVAAKVSGGAGGRIVHRTKFDADGNPTKVDFEVRYEGGFGGGGSAGKVSGQRKKRARTEHIYSLDLTDPKNREAYNGVFNTDSGYMAVPTGLHDSQAVADLAKQFGTQGTESRATFDTTKETSSGNIKVAGTGGGYESDTTDSHLNDFEYRDNSKSGEWTKYQC